MSTLEERINANQARIKAGIAKEKAEEIAAKEAVAAERRARREAAMAAEEAAIAEVARRNAQSKRNAAAYREKVEAEAKAVANTRANQSRINRERATAKAKAAGKKKGSASAAASANNNNAALEDAIAAASDPAAIAAATKSKLDPMITDRLNSIILHSSRHCKILMRDTIVQAGGNYTITPGYFHEMICLIIIVKLNILASKVKYNDPDSTKYIKAYNNFKKDVHTFYNDWNQSIQIIKFSNNINDKLVVTKANKELFLKVLDDDLKEPLTWDTYNTLKGQYNKILKDLLPYKVETGLGYDFILNDSKIKHTGPLVGGFRKTLRTKRRRFYTRRR